VLEEFWLANVTPLPLTIDQLYVNDPNGNPSSTAAATSVALAGNVMERADCRLMTGGVFTGVGGVVTVAWTSAEESLSTPFEPTARTT
jgi:hypothetical protein